MRVESFWVSMNQQELAWYDHDFVKPILGLTKSERDDILKNRCRLFIHDGQAILDYAGIVRG